MQTIEFVTDMICVEADADDSILEASLKAGIAHVHDCGGKGKCATCRVLVMEGLEHCSLQGRDELLIAQKIGFTPRMRLACQTKLNGNVAVRRLVMDHDDSSSKRDHGLKATGPIGRERLATILFADIQGFTPFAESLPAFDVVHVLNRYFMKMGDVISKNGGKIHNYMGDGFMALFGVEENECRALNAIRAGLGLLEAMDQFKEYLRQFYFRDLDIRVGVHCGEVIWGEIGSRDLKQMTAIGDAVNFTSRIEALNKQAKSRFLISEFAYERVKEHVVAEAKLTEINIQGIKGAHTVYEVFSLREKKIEHSSCITN